MKRILRVLTFCVAAALIYVAIVVGQVWYAASLDEAKLDQDAIVVMGAAQYNGVPSPVLKARLDHAANLWKRKIAPIIVVTGGRAPGDNSTEAAASAAYLSAKGVPDSAVLREVQGRSSWESLQATSRFLSGRQIKKIVLVSDAFHNARIAAMARELNFSATVSPTKSSPITGGEQLPYLFKEVVAVGVGQIIGFSRIAILENHFLSSSAS